MNNFERVLLVKHEVFVFRLPPRQSNRSYRAADWKLDSPDWTGRMRIIDVNNELVIKLEDKNSGDLFAKCPVDAYPGLAIESVLDSSRYFAIRLKDDNGKTAFVGIGFADRSDSFDMNVCIQDWFKQQRNEHLDATGATDAESGDASTRLDLRFKEGETIKLNLATKRPQGESKSKLSSVKTGASGGPIGLLPPPPSSKPRNTVNVSNNENNNNNTTSKNFTDDWLLN